MVGLQKVLTPVVVRCQLALRDCGVLDAVKCERSTEPDARHVYWNVQELMLQ